jgi:hypothetical protein
MEHHANSQTEWPNSVSSTQKMPDTYYVKTKQLQVQAVK